jgi:sulfonate transport system ATP-binding protein
MGIGSVALQVHQSKKQGAHIQLKALQKSFKGKQVLSAIDLDIEPGQFVAVIGRSGSGKSTLLRLLSGLERPTSGQVIQDGVQLTGTHPETTVMFQEAMLLPWKRVIENVGIGLKGEWQVKAEKLLTQVGLKDKMQEWPSVLSGGQKQRVALARALVRNPKLLLLDEPLSALDALTRLEMQQLIEELWLEQGFTTLLVTHDVSEAVRLADRILLIEEGAIAMDLHNRIPRPREHTDQHFAELEKQVLDRIMRKPPGGAK